ncbi:hypothetical protein [Thalassoglobus polymorphus]|uniref:Uncharacterized protein n=1 Tax=Thalassoglobus polymorphus TaxID=2527994 RepID=A0A517QRH1_9PLAN|nr:hypothetical protein [Thalassoglobus polymorphus]QDT34226.1 hypothetical protein Mal48_34860 [Thalassoglobus polymorphus]
MTNIGLAIDEYPSAILYLVFTLTKTADGPSLKSCVESLIGGP